jgi:NADH:ubiquinone oxidoreductase subunit D
LNRTKPLWRRKRPSDGRTPRGPNRAAARSPVLTRAPPKDELYETIEGTIQHFKIIMEGLKLPAGEVYSYTEAGNGELGFYLVSDGSGNPVPSAHAPAVLFYDLGNRAHASGSKTRRSGAVFRLIEQGRR